MQLVLKQTHSNYAGMTVRGVLLNLLVTLRPVWTGVVFRESNLLSEIAQPSLQVGHA